MTAAGPEAPAWELSELARLEAGRCPVCRALPPNHFTDCTEIEMPDPEAEQCPGCEFPAGTLGCRMAHRGAS